jgi:hypothetical protein
MLDTPMNMDYGGEVNNAKNNVAMVVISSLLTYIRTLQVHSTVAE